MPSVLPDPDPDPEPPPPLELVRETAVPVLVLGESLFDPLLLVDLAIGSPVR
jgi:hypothetical protein